MPRRFLFILAAVCSLAGYNLVYSQDAPATPPSNTTTSAADAAAPASDDMATLKAQNAALKNEVSDAAATIAKLQAQLAQGGGSQPAATAATASTPPPAGPDATAPGGPQKALPLDSTNVVTTPGGPGGADAGPSKTYKVVKGDSLWKIAHKMYPGDTKNGVDKLNEANKDTIAGKPLKIGQVLIVPQ
jgi:Tfp pilus assembly protein FimV